MIKRIARISFDLMRKISSPLIPAKAGTQKRQGLHFAALGPGFRRDERGVGLYKTLILRFALTFCAALALSACGGPENGDAPEAASTETAAPAASQPAPVQTAAYVPKPPADTSEGIFARQCAYCHAPGIDHPGTLQLSVTRGEDFAVLAEREDLTADYVKYIVRNGLNGMPSFTPTTLTDAELDTVAAYLVKGE